MWVMDFGTLNIRGAPGVNCGGDVEYPIHRYFLWAKEVELMLGGANLQLARIGTQLQSI
jgi:hypothetical protein